MCQAVEEWKQELLDEGYANGEKIGIEKGEKIGIEKGEKLGQAVLLKNMIRNSNLGLSEIARMTRQSLSMIETLAKEVSISLVKVRFTGAWRMCTGAAGPGHIDMRCAPYVNRGATPSISLETLQNNPYKSRRFYAPIKAILGL